MEFTASEMTYIVSSGALNSTHSLTHSLTHSFLRRADARGSDDIIYRIWCISPVCGSGI